MCCNRRCGCRNGSGYGYNSVRATASDPVCRKEYNCGADQQVIRHQDVVRHQHNIVNEYDVVHVHDYDYYDVVKSHDVVRSHDHTSYKPNYCGDCGCGCNNGGEGGAETDQ